MREFSSDIVQNSEGVWVANAKTPVYYPSEGSDRCIAVEDSSFWFQHRNRCIVELIKNFPPEKLDYIFDIGGGNGCVTSAMIKEGFNAVLVEPSPAGVQNAKQRDIQNIIFAPFQDINFYSNSLGAVSLFDVVEHIEEDGVFLKSIQRVLKPNGKLYLTVPAYPWLWSSDDEYSGHFRRYTVHSIATLVAKAGFIVDFTSYFFRIVPIPSLLFKALPYRLGLSREPMTVNSIARDHLVKKGLRSRIIEKLLSFEQQKIAKLQPMALGGSCLLVARKL